MENKSKYPLSYLIPILVEQKYGYVKDLLEELVVRGFANNKDEAYGILENLHLIGYLKLGTDKNYNQTWSITKLAKNDNFIKKGLKSYSN